MTTPASEMVDVLLVDDEALVRAGLTMILRSAPDIAIVGEASDGVEAVEQVRTLSPDVVLMDIRMPRMDGIRALTLIRELDGPPHVIMLTTFDADELIFESLQSGAAGFLLKDTSPQGLIQAVRTVVAGNAILSPQLTRRVATVFAQKAPKDLLNRVETLTDRERQILPLIAEGASNSDIGRSLFVSEPTVKAHVTHILNKLGCENRVQIAIVAYRAGLADVPNQ